MDNNMSRRGMDRQLKRQMVASDQRLSDARTLRGSKHKRDERCRNPEQRGVQQEMGQGSL